MFTLVIWSKRSASLKSHSVECKNCKHCRTRIPLENRFITYLPSFLQLGEDCCSQSGIFVRHCFKNLLAPCSCPVASFLNKCHHWEPLACLLPKSGDQYLVSSQMHFVNFSSCEPPSLLCSSPKEPLCLAAQEIPRSLGCCGPEVLPSFLQFSYISCDISPWDRTNEYK